MSISSGMICLTLCDLYLQPNEFDVENGVTWYHEKLLLPSGSQVTIVDEMNHGVTYVVGDRWGFARYEYFQTYSETNPFIFSESSNEGHLVPTPVKKVQFCDESSLSGLSEDEPSLESIMCPSIFSDNENFGPIESRRGDDIDELNDTLLQMNLAEKPSASSTPMPPIIHRPRDKAHTKKRQVMETTMPVAGDFTNDKNTNLIISAVEQLGRQLTHLVHQATVNINTNTNAAVCQYKDEIIKKIDSCYENSTVKRAEIIQIVQSSQNLIQNSQQNVLNAFKNISQSTQNLGANLAGMSANMTKLASTRTTNQKVQQPEAADATMADPGMISAPVGVNSCSYLPPSSNSANIQSELGFEEDRATQDALKFIRTHPEKVPKWSAYSGKMCMALFCCKVLYKFAKQQAVRKVYFLDRWLGYAFENIEERMHMHLTSVRQEFPRVGLFRTLQELARKMCPDDFVSLEKALGYRKPNETLVDFAIRLYTDIPICKDLAESDIPRTALEYIRLHEKDENVNIELRRELLNRNNAFSSAVISKQELLDIMEKVDRLRKIGATMSSVHAAKAFERDSDASRKSDKQEVLTAIHGLANQISDNKFSFGGKPMCKKCGKAHGEVSPQGRPRAYCKFCFSQMISNRNSYSNASKRPIFSQPRISAAVCAYPNCRIPAPKGTNGQALKYCYSCFLKVKKGNISDIKEFNQITLDEIDNSVVRTQAEILKPQSIYELSHGRNFDEKRYRMSVTVTNQNKKRPIKALFDTGCNTEVLSLKACRMLGIENLINKNSRSKARGVDDRDLGVIGEVEVTLNVGDIPYRSKFQVLDVISGYDMMIGTRFMLSNDLMHKIFEAAQQTLGKNNVTRGN